MLLERRRSLRTDEMATNGGRERTPSPPVSPKEAQKRPNLSIFLLFNLRLRFLEAGALITVHVLIDGSPRASRIGRAGPRRAPKCARDARIWTLWNAYFYTIFVDHKLSDRGFLLYPAAQL